MLFIKPSTILHGCQSVLSARIPGPGVWLLFFEVLSGFVPIEYAAPALVGGCSYSPGPGDFSLLWTCVKPLIGIENAGPV